MCLGNPRQEYWVEDHLAELDLKLVWGAGGALDFYSGDVPLAPDWVQRAGFEWLFRLVTNFSIARLRRQLRLVQFMALVLAERLRRGRGRAHGPMRSLVAWLGILVVRVGFLLGRVLPLRAGVVLATRDAEHPGGNLVAIRRELARVCARGAGPRHRLPDAVRCSGAGRDRVGGAAPGLPPGHRRACWSPTTGCSRSTPHGRGGAPRGSRSGTRPAPSRRSGSASSTAPRATPTRRATCP